MLLISEITFEERRNATESEIPTSVDPEIPLTSEITFRERVSPESRTVSFEISGWKAGNVREITKSGKVKLVVYAVNRGKLHVGAG